ncbi:MAG TPA: trigger factor [Candidatus Paceibacterota bacterium]|nr:trigger factor [Candidatus Paceibacterota bacterium]
MNVTTTKNDAANSILELTVELGQEDLAGYVKKAEEAYAKELEIPGFRKGKAPLEKVREKVGAPAILETALQSAIEGSLSKVIAEQKLDVLEASNLKVQENSAERLVYAVSLQLFPSATLPDLKTVKVERKEVKVEPKEIDETLESIRSSRAVTAEKEGPAAQGDRVEVDFEINSDGQLIKDGISKNHPVIIGRGNFVPGFEEQLIGMKKGEQKEFSLEVPAEFSNKDIAGKKLDFKVTMQDVKSMALPEMNDDFAKSVGKFDNLDQLIMNVKDGLLQEKQDRERQRARLQIMDRILEKAKCSVPEAMITNQLDSMIQNLDQDLHRHDMELGLYLSKIGKTQEELRKEWRLEAERQVKMALILHEVIRENGISVSPEEIEQAMESLVQSTIMRGQGNDQLDLERIRNSLRSQLLNEKTFEFLEKTCIA